MSDFLWQRLEATRTALELAELAHLERPLRLVSFANTRGASQGAVYARAERVKTHRQVGFAAGQLFRPHLASVRARYFVVRLTRMAPRAMDDDNLANAFKSVRDGVASALGVNDRDARVRYVTDQVPGEHLVRIALYAQPRAPSLEVDASDYERPAPSPVLRAGAPTPNVVRPRP